MLELLLKIINRNYEFHCKHMYTIANLDHKEEAVSDFFNLKKELPRNSLLIETTLKAGEYIKFLEDVKNTILTDSERQKLIEQSDKLSDWFREHEKYTND